VVAVGLMYLWIVLCCDVTLPSAAYGTIRAFLLAEFAASLEWQIYTYYAQMFQPARLFDFWGCVVVVYGLVFGLFSWWEDRRDAPASAWVFQWKELYAPLIIGILCFAMSNLSFVYSTTPFSSSLTHEIYNIRTLVDLSGVIMLYAYHTQRGQLLTQRERDALESTLQSQYAQYCQSRENIDLINRKYHDLKHQIAVLRTETDSDKRAAFLDEMERGITGYEAQNKTGNPVLDTVLTGKSLQCIQHHIELTCVVDGTLVEFMDVMDVCTMFGNLLDNAIECELTIPEEEKRLISLKVHSNKNFVVIHCENYCPTPPNFQDGLPVTTKADKSLHGYGVRSIRHTAEKYGGSMSIQFQDQWFELNILLPATQDSAV
jgi:hypothetical protein